MTEQTATIPTTSLSVAVTAAWRVFRDYVQTRYYDSMIDGGEWSATAGAEAFDHQLDVIARWGGFRDYDEMLDAVAARTSDRWVYMNMPSPAH